MEYNKILIIRLSSLGDIVLTQPVAAVLHRKFPNAEIHFLTKKAFVDVVKAFGCIDIIHVWEENKSFSQLLKLKRLKFDLVIDLHNKLNTFWIKAVVCGRKTVTYNKQHLLRLKIVKHRTEKVISSTVQLYFSALAKAGIEAEIENPQLVPTANLPSQITKKLTNDKINLAIFPGALHKTKQYPLEQLAQVINALDDKCNIFLLGSPDEQNLVLLLVKIINTPVHDLCGKLSIAELISFLSSVDLVISNDSGPMHIAAALHKPQIAIFGATHPKLGFAPMNDKAIILKTDLNCQPCSLHGGEICPLGHLDCLKKISAAEIIKSVETVSSEMDVKK